MKTAAWETREAYQYDANHPDRLTKITTYDLTNNTSSVKTIGNYDELGNPRSYKGNTLTWVRGRVLKSYGNKASYEYDGENIRQKKTEGGRTHEYYTGIDGRILGERVTENGIQTMYRYMYEGEQVIGLVKNGTEVYHYQYGTSGDIVRICDAQGSVVARYNYDAWGKCRVYTSNWVDITENSGYNNHIGRINPFRYKGYYYDEGTGLYYLQSRYYDPETRRFVNADNVGVVSEDYLTTIGGQNLYSYSLNNPVNHYDPTGHSVITTVIGLLLSVIMLIGSIYGLVEATKAFLKEPSWLNLLFGLLALADAVMSLIAIVKLFKTLAQVAKKTAADYIKPAPGYIKTVDGVDIYKAQRKDFTKEAWKEIKKLKRNSSGETISNTRSGQKIHKGFKRDFERLEIRGGGRKVIIEDGVRKIKTCGFADAFDDATKTIFELKANNARSIKAGIEQLHRYAKAYQNMRKEIPRLVLVLY